MDDETLRTKCQVMDAASDLYKKKDYVKAYETAKETIASDEVPEAFYLSCAWIIYRYLKQMAGNISDENIEVCSKFFFSHLKQPSLVRSLFLVQMIELSKNNTRFDFLAFCIRYDICNLRPDDFMGNEIKTDSQVIHYDSLAEKLATRIYNIMKSTKSPHYSSLLMPFFEEVKQKCNKNKFIDMYIGLLHYWKGETEAARKAFIHILLTDPQWYIWKNMMYVSKDAEEKTAFCCKAATLVSDERFKGNLHLQLAELLVDSDPPHAAMEIGQLFDTYESNNWRICGDAYILKNKLSGVAAASDSTAFYRIHAKKAEEIVYGSLEPVEMTYSKEITVRGKRKANLYSSSQKVSLNVSVSRLGQGAKVGDIFMVRFNMINHKPIVLTIDFTRHSSTPSTKRNHEKTEINGKVTLPRNGDYAFIDYKYYVPARLRFQHDLCEGQEIRALASKTEDGKWRITRILE